MLRTLKIMGTSLLLAGLVASPLRAASREVKILESAAGVVQGMSVIPWGLLHNAAGVAIIPHAIRTALVVDGEFGRGVVLVHEPDGRWSNPVFVTLHGAGIGGQAGIEASDLVLVFTTRHSLDRALQGKLTLGQDVSIAAGPLGRDFKAEVEGRPLRPEIYSYSRSRGLFAGLSVERARLHLDAHANRAFYGVREGSPAEVLGRRVSSPAAEMLKARLLGLKAPAVAPPASHFPPPAPKPFRR